jgi:hypothetical protein
VFYQRTVYVHIIGLLRRQYNLYHTCNTHNNLILWIVFDALKFELTLYERSGRLIFGSDRRGADFKSSHAALASDIGMLA